MSRSTDRAKAAEAADIRFQRIEHMCQQILVVTKLRREGLALEVIAHRLGWSTRTLVRWLSALKLIERRGIKMAERRINP